MTFREWLRDPRCEGERRQAAILGVVVGVSLAGVILLGLIKQCQMERDRLTIEQPASATPPPATSLPEPAEEPAAAAARPAP